MDSKPTIKISVEKFIELLHQDGWDREYKIVLTSPEDRHGIICVSSTKDVYSVCTYQAYIETHKNTYVFIDTSDMPYKLIVDNIEFSDNELSYIHTRIPNKFKAFSLMNSNFNPDYMEHIIVSEYEDK